MDTSEGPITAGNVVIATGPYQRPFVPDAAANLGDVIQLPARKPAHRRGVTGVPGAYFLGLPLLHRTKSSFLSGVGDDATFIADHIDSHRPRCTLNEAFNVRGKHD